jgi:hypothetical protein
MNASEFWKPDGDAPPGLSPSEISSWESGMGVELPPLLAQALALQNGGAVRGVALFIDPLQEFASLNSEKWAGVWEDNPSQEKVDRSRQIYIGDSIGVGIVLDYSMDAVPRVLLLHHEGGRELRDHDIGTFEQLLEVAKMDGAGSDAEP